jgi:hypothetical protein
MRNIGFSLLIAGFLWIAWDCAAGFVGYQYTRWIWGAQHLPEGETIRRDDAAGAMRALSLDLKDRHRELLIPAFIMLAGGLILGSRRRGAEPDAAPNSRSPSQLSRSPEVQTSDSLRTPFSGGGG